VRHEEVTIEQQRVLQRLTDAGGSTGIGYAIAEPEI